MQMGGLIDERVISWIISSFTIKNDWLLAILLLQFFFIALFWFEDANDRIGKFLELSRTTNFAYFIENKSLLSMCYFISANVYNVK